MNISESIDKKQNLNLVLIGNGSKIFNKNSFQLEDKYNFKDINFYEENDHEICEAGLIFNNGNICEVICIGWLFVARNLKVVYIYICIYICIYVYIYIYIYIYI